MPGSTLQLSTPSSLEETLFMYHPRPTATHLRTSFFALASVLCLAVAPAQARSAPAATPQASWVGTWAAAPFSGDPWHHVPTLVDSTLRQIIHTSIAGRALRVHFTNEFGTEPLRIDAASVAISAGDSAIQPGSIRSLTFAAAPPSPSPQAPKP